MNVRELIRLEGDGEPVLGYKIWANNMYVEAVPHCVLKRLDGTLTDPTFNVDGEKTVLFVEAPNLHTATISNLGEKPCEALDPDVEFLVALKKLEDAMTLLEFPTEEEAWMTELTYEQSLERRTV